MNRLIAICGAKGAGKGVIASALTDSGFTLVKFAGPLKDMLRALGLSEAQIEGDRKETPCALLCGQTPRHAMQTLGTEWGRNHIGSDFWVNAWRAAAGKHDNVVVDDCRFPNEAGIVKALGGELWRVVRPGFNGDGHESETHELPWDLTLYNHGSIDELRARAARLMQTSRLRASVESRFPVNLKALSAEPPVSGSR